MEWDEDFIYIEKSQKGDLHAFSFLVNKYKNMVYTVALKITGNTQDSEDIAQESFIKVYQQIKSFKKESKFSTWLYTITYRTTLYHLRKNKINTRAIIENDNQISINNQINELKIKEQQGFIRSAIDRLPKMEGLLVTLFYIDENSIDEIHSITGLSHVNIKVKLYRSRKKLKKELNSLLKNEIKSIF